jgi:RNA-directed DNA polymerase
MTKAPIALQELRRRIYWKAKAEKAHRFWGIFVHVTRKETLEEACRIAKRNGGAAGSDGQTFEAIETVGLDGFLAALRDDLETGRYKPHPNRRVDIPKEQGKFRTLQIPNRPGTLPPARRNRNHVAAFAARSTSLSQPRSTPGRLCGLQTTG